MTPHDTNGSVSSPSERSEGAGALGEMDRVEIDLGKIIAGYSSDDDLPESLAREICDYLRKRFA